MVIELAWRFFFVNYLTDGNDTLKKLGKRENGDLRSIGVIAGFEIRVTGYGLRVASCGSFDSGFRIRDMGLKILIGWLLRCRLRGKYL